LCGNFEERNRMYLMVAQEATRKLIDEECNVRVYETSYLYDISHLITYKTRDMPEYMHMCISEFSSNPSVFDYDRNFMNISFGFPDGVIRSHINPYMNCVFDSDEPSKGDFFRQHEFANYVIS
jgi:hypothetical protein